MNHIPNINFTLQHDLCMGCGVCESACPFKAISIVVKNGRFLPKIDEQLCHNKKGCHRCYDTCGGLGINLLGMVKQIHADSDTKQHALIGTYRKCYTGFSKDETLRTNAASGGVLSQFLIWLLENNKIDGAVVTRFDKDAPFKVHTFIAKTKEDVLSAKGSKYGPVSLHSVIQEIKKSEGKRFVIVGLPCHVHSIRKLMSRDKKLRDKTVGIFSLFCSGSQTFHYTEYILKQCGGNVAGLEYLAYREGYPSGMVAKGKGFDFFKEYHKYNMPLKGTFYPRRCLLCVDMLGELFDISFGDIYVDTPEEAGTGISAIIARSKLWEELLQEAVDANAIHLDEITEEKLLYKRSMAKAKKTRNASFVQLLKRLHKDVPEYDSVYYGKVSAKIALKYAVMRAKQLVGNHHLLWFLLPKIK